MELQEKSLFTQKPEIEIDFIESLKGEKFKGEFLFIQKREVLKFSKWPEKIWGYEGIRHWEINKSSNFLYKETIGRIYYRDRKENLTSPEGTILRANNMVDGINYLLKKHGDKLKFTIETGIFILILQKRLFTFV